MLNPAELSAMEEIRISLDEVVTYPPPAAAPLHTAESHLMEPPEPYRPPSPAPTTAHSEASTVSPQPLIRPEASVTPSPLSHQTSIRRSNTTASRPGLFKTPTYRSVASVLPPYSRWGNGDKYETLSGIESQVNLSSERRGCWQHQWRIWAAVVLVIVVTIVTIVAALLQQRNPSS
jgi:hypothetical protein